MAWLRTPGWPEGGHSPRLSTVNLCWSRSDHRAPSLSGEIRPCCATRCCRHAFLTHIVCFIDACRPLFHHSGYGAHPAHSCYADPVRLSSAARAPARCKAPATSQQHHTEAFMSWLQGWMRLDDGDSSDVFAMGLVSPAYSAAGQNATAMWHTLCKIILFQHSFRLQPGQTPCMVRSSKESHCSTGDCRGKRVV